MSSIAAASFFFACKYPVLDYIVGWPVSPFMEKNAAHLAREGITQVPPAPTGFFVSNKLWLYPTSVYFIQAGLVQIHP